MGGVDSGKAAYDKFLLGADYVQLYTGMVFQGPNIAGIIKKDLKELLIIQLIFHHLILRILEIFMIRIN